MKAAAEEDNERLEALRIEANQAAEEQKAYSDEQIAQLEAARDSLTEDKIKAE